MGSVPLVPSAMLLALVSAKPEPAGKSPDASNAIVRGGGTPVAERRALEAFLQMNPEEKFDLEVVNSIDLRAIIEQTGGDKRILREVVRTAEALLPRVRAETEDPILVSAILRNKTLDWSRRSPSDSSWAEDMPVRWGGMFHESRVPGGRLSRKLSTRLASLIDQSVQASGPVAFFRAGFTGIFRGSAMMASMVQFGLGSKRPRFTQQVAQAYLDDLAANPRSGTEPLPLERLSAVAKRNGSAEVNITLVELFSQEDTGTLTVLDSRFHPGLDAIKIRMVRPKGAEEAVTYDLVQGGARSTGAGGASDEAMMDTNSASPWERPEMTKKDWLALFRSLEKRKARLGPPPRENARENESYQVLRDLLLADVSVRRAFLAVHWKGRPSGLALLCQLLTDGAFAAEVETDADYLEAELDHPDHGQGEHQSKNGQWKLGHGWIVVRDVAKGNVRTYRATGKSAD